MYVMLLKNYNNDNLLLTKGEVKLHRSTSQTFKGEAMILREWGAFACMLTLVLSSGCSVFMAAKQPDKKNVELFRVGTPRSVLLGEFGAPAVTEIRDGKKYEIFKFVQGYSTGAKAGRALFHGAADVMTLGLWEVVGTPTEAIFSGEEMAFEVSYDEDDQVDQITVLKKK